MFNVGSHYLNGVHKAVLVQQMIDDKDIDVQFAILVEQNV